MTFSALEPFADPYRRLVWLARRLEDDGLRAVVEQSKRVSTTNCGADVYRVAPIARALALRELERRDFEKRLRAAAGGGGE